jgi:transposase
MDDEQPADTALLLAAVQVENATLRGENAALRGENATLQAEKATLCGENATLREQVAAGAAREQVLEEQMAAATVRLAELEQDAQRRRTFGKAARPRREGPAKPRKVRAATQNHGRPLDPPTAFASHQYERCPDCDYPLRGGSVWWERQVVDLPPPPPLVVTEHQFIRRWCPVCAKWCVPPVPADLAFGQGRLGPGIASLVATLRTVLRLPIAQIQLYLASLHGLHLSRGGIVDLLRRLAQVSAPAVAALQVEIQASPIIHGDETGWRENGQHGYVWLLATPGPAAACYFERDRGRSHAVLARLLGPDARGVLASDFYGSYNDYPGPHQRCWAHLLRDLHALKEDHPQHWGARAWARAVRRLYTCAQGFLHSTDPPTQEQRQRYYDRLIACTHRLGLRYAQATDHPCRVLAKRLLRHEDELFQFVRVPGLSADNNLAERCIRPLAVARKISGGTRSPEGSQTRMRLASLFGTWQARGLNPFTACLALLLSLLRQA